MAAPAPVPPSGPQSLLLLPQVMAAELDAEMPTAAPLLAAACLALRLPHILLFAGNASQPVLRVANQSFNHFSDLAFQLRALRGRQALRVARSPFELHVTLLDVTTDPSAAKVESMEVVCGAVTM